MMYWGLDFNNLNNFSPITFYTFRTVEQTNGSDFASEHDRPSNLTLNASGPNALRSLVVVCVFRLITAWNEQERESIMPQSSKISLSWGLSCPATGLIFVSVSVPRVVFQNTIRFGIKNNNINPLILLG